MAGHVYKVGAIILEGRKLLVVRKKGTALFIAPGGKQQPGESALETLARELKEELGVSLVGATFFARFEDTSAFESAPIVMDVYESVVSGAIRPASEIEECRWVQSDFGSRGVKLGSILAKHIIPRLILGGRM